MAKPKVDTPAMPKLILPRGTARNADPPEGYVEPVRGAPAEARTTPHLSYSQLAMYLRCSFQYWYKYVDHMPEMPKVSLALGKGGHEALELNTKTKIATGADLPLEKLLDESSKSMDHYLNELPRKEYERDVEPGALKDRFLAATKVYRERDAESIQPIAAELEFTLDVHQYLPAEYIEKLTVPIRPVVMYMDNLYQDQQTKVTENPIAAALGVEDYKFVTKKRSQEEVNLSPQLTTYTVGVHQLTGKLPTKLGYRQFTPGSFAKKPRPDTDGPNSTLLLRDPAMMTKEALERRMARVAFQFAKAEEGIRKGVFIPTDDPRVCSWCPFRQRCQASLTDDFEAAIIREKTNPPPLLGE